MNQPQPPRDDRVVVDMECPRCQGTGWVETGAIREGNHTADGRTCWYCHGRRVIEVEVPR